MKKKKKGQKKLTAEEKEYNKNISRIRVKVENHFADLKQWKVLSHVYRGDLKEHFHLFLTCEFLTLLQKNQSSVPDNSSESLSE